jgi:hypothetical protein
VAQTEGRDAAPGAVDQPTSIGCPSWDAIASPATSVLSRSNHAAMLPRVWPATASTRASCSQPRGWSAVSIKLKPSRSRTAYACTIGAQAPQPSGQLLEFHRYRFVFASS